MYITINMHGDIQAETRVHADNPGKGHHAFTVLDLTDGRGACLMLHIDTPEGLDGIADACRYAAETMRKNSLTTEPASTHTPEVEAEGTGLDLIRAACDLLEVVHRPSLLKPWTLTNGTGITIRAYETKEEAEAELARLRPGCRFAVEIDQGKWGKRLLTEDFDATAVATWPTEADAQTIADNHPQRDTCTLKVVPYPATV